LQWLPSIFVSTLLFPLLKVFFSGFLLLLLLDKGQHAKCKASIRYVLARLFALGHKTQMRGEKIMEAPPDMGAISKATTVCVFAQGRGLWQG